MDWNQRYLAGDTPWDKGYAAPPLVEFLQKSQKSLWGDGEILVPGCGTGHDVRILAALGLKVCGLDLAEEAIQRAMMFPKVHEERFEKGDLFDRAWQKGKNFSAIWEHTCFCAIDPKQREIYVKACADLLSPGACLIAVFFLTPFDPSDEKEGPPHPSSVQEIDGLFTKAFERQESWVPKQSYPGREGREWLAIYRRK